MMSILGRRIGKVLETLALYLVSEAQVEVGASLISNNFFPINAGNASFFFF